MNIVAVGIACFPEIHVAIEYVSIQPAIGHVVVGIRQQESIIGQVKVLIVDVVAVVQVGSFDDIFQTIAVSVDRATNRSQGLAVAGFHGVADSIVVTVGIKVVRDPVAG